MSDLETDTVALIPRNGVLTSYGLVSGDFTKLKRSWFPYIWGVPFVTWCSLSAATIMLVNGVGLGYTSPTLTELGAIDNPNQRIADKSVESSLFAVSM